MAIARRQDLPNVILIVLDTLRADHLSIYGYPRPTSPYLEELAARGTVYLNAMAPEIWTLPSHASLFTGTFPSTHHTDHANYVLPSHLMTLAEVLRGVGYRCGGASNNAWVSQMTGLDRGFHRFVLGGRLLKPAEVGGEYIKRGPWSFPAYLINKTYRQFFKLRYGDGAPWINRMAMQWVRGDPQDSPFFLFLNYREPHLAYSPPAPYRSQFLDQPCNGHQVRQVNQDAYRFMAGKVSMAEEDFDVLRALYDGEIRYLDDCLRQLFQLLQQQGYLDNSLIIITSDHGENIGEHGLMDHQYCVYDTLARVPLICARPGDFGVGTTVTELVQLHDVFPTILDLLGIDGPIREQNQAQSLLQSTPRPLAVVEHLAPAQHVIARRFPDIDLRPFQRTFRAIRMDRYKLIQASDDQHELYDVVADPGEQVNLIASHPDIARSLGWKLEEWVHRHSISSRAAGASGEFDKDIEERLRDLGYI